MFMVLIFHRFTIRMERNPWFGGIIGLPCAVWQQTAQVRIHERMNEQSIRFFTPTAFMRDT